MQGMSLSKLKIDRFSLVMCTRRVMISYRSVPISSQRGGGTFI